MQKKLTIGLPRIHAEAGERRDFLPAFIAGLETNGYRIFLERGYGAGVGFKESDYLEAAPSVRFVSWQQTYRQRYTLVLRYPGDQVLRWMRPGSCLISMLHFPTRPQRVKLLRELGLEALSLDSIKDDTGRRLVENLQAVAWNGVEVAFQVLAKTYPPPGLESPKRPPVRVTLLGAGNVGAHVVQAAIRYGDEEYRSRLAGRKAPGVQLTVVDYDLSGHADFMQPILRQTDLLIDATQRPDPGRPVIPNDWVGWLPPHAVILDLAVDPYDFSMEPPEVKGIEGIPQGNLDQYIFAPDDPVYERLPPGICSLHRRYVVSCYSWPGIHPRECMDVYGKQLRPLLRTISERNGVENIREYGNFFERAIWRAMLSHWQPA